MGKNKKGFRAKANTKSEKKRSNEGGEWVQELKNEKFEQYYKAQKIISVNDWPIFMQSLREPLPTTFRLAGSRETTHELNNTIRSTYIPQLTNVVFEGEVVRPPTQIPWYPEGLAWHLNVPKSVVRRSPEFKRFHNFLVYETDVGNISRQEAVSMIPPLFLDVQPHHLVLDMCAAPGSKTAQLLEAMHTPSSDHSPNIPPGLLIANDNDFKRTHLLVHQSSRLPSPALLVTNLDASNYPNIAVSSSSSPSAVPSVSGTLRFDRILCDVPCSGDGTLRKNLGIWRHWNPMDANGLHSLQLRILLRAMKLLKPAGRIVYSTCSLNPVENEAVIAAALRTSPEFELVDVSSQLPALIRKPGLEEWFPVVDKELTAYPTFAAFFSEWQEKGQQPNQLKMAETHWPPEDIAGLNLTRCLRIYPHLQDMGGFFVAVLRRKESAISDEGGVLQARAHGKRVVPEDLDESPPFTKKSKTDGLPSAPVEVDLQQTSSQTLVDSDDGVHIAEGVHVDSMHASIRSVTPKSLADALTCGKDKSEEPGGKKGRGKEKKEDARGKFKEPPYTFLESDHPQLRDTIERLELSDSFPVSNIFVRHPDGGGSAVPLRSMYLCNDMVKRVISANDYARIRLVSAGTKIFTRQDAGSIINEDGEKIIMQQQFRVLDDAISVILPFTPPELILSGTLKELRILLETYYPLTESFDEPFRTTIGTKENGNYLVRFDAAEWNGGLLNHSIVLPLWKSNASVSLMTDKKSKSALCLRMFGEDITVAGKQLLEHQRKTQERRDAAAAAKEMDTNGAGSDRGGDTEGVDTD